MKERMGCVCALRLCPLFRDSHSLHLFFYQLAITAPLCVCVHALDDDLKSSSRWQ